MKLSDLLKEPEYRLLFGTEDKDVKALKYRSDKCAPGDAFFALRGRDADGHDFLSDAAARGAGVLLVEDPASVSSLRLSGNIRANSADSMPAVIQVPDTRTALAQAACAFYRHPSQELLTVGITGTKGKTTTAFLLQAILERAGIPAGMIGTVHCGYPGHYETARNTTPESCEIQKMLRRMCDAGCRAVVMEVSSQGLKYSRTAGIFFDYALFTNLAPDHIGPGEHADFEEYAYWKSRLFTGCRTAVLNEGDPGWKRMDAVCSAQKKILFRVCTDTGSSKDMEAYDLRLIREDGVLGSVFSLRGCGRPFRIGLPGIHNVENALGAIAVAKDLNIADEIIREALWEARVPGRTEIAVSSDYIALVDYAHNGTALRHLLKTLRQYRPRRLLLVFGCGGERDRTRRVEMGRAAAELADFSILTSDNPRREDPQRILGDIAAAMQEARGVWRVIEDRREAIRAAVRMAEAGDILVVAGKGHETYQLIGSTIRHFDDREELRKGLEK